MIELLRHAAQDDADRIALIVGDDSYTYGELVASAEAVAAGLSKRAIDRFAILDHDAATAVALLAGASLVGAEACIYPPTDDGGQIRTLTERFAHELLVGSRADLREVGTTVSLRELTDTTGPAAPEDVASVRPHLILTTGTTGAPRGVRHDWSRMLRSTTRIRPAVGERWLLAYGLHQFAGLQILVHVFASSATVIAPAPRRPREGLAAMRKYRVTHVSATPTYWRFLLAEMRADGGPAPELEQVTLGGEAVPGPLLNELAARFPTANISQVYAASEFGSTGSMRDGRNGLSLDVLERGEEADIDMKIIDGQLWVRSRVGMLGYYGEDPVDADGWRASGDLVEIVGDRILFLGRASEIINVGGVKVHPLPVEERLGTVPGVDIARVYGRPNPLTGAIVAVEVVAAPGADTDTIRTAIRAACADLPAASRPRSIRFVDTVAMAGNKIVRRVVR